MDALIKKQNFMKVKDEDIPDEFNETLSEWMSENEDKVNGNMIVNCIKAIEKQVCRDDFSHVETPPAYMAINAMENTWTIMGDYVDNGKGSYKEFHETMYEFLLKLIACGPGSIHCKFFGEIISQSCLEFPEYFKTIKREKMVAVIRALKRKYYTKDGTPAEEYADLVDRLIANVLDDLFEDEQYPEYKTEFAELYDYFKSNSDNKENFLKQALLEKAESIEYKFDGNIYKVTKSNTSNENGKDQEAMTDMDRVKEQFNKLSKTVTETKFPADEDDMKSVKNVLSKLLDAIEDSGSFEQTYESIMNFLMVLFEKKSGKKVHDIIEKIGYYFYHVDEKNNKIKKNEKLFVGVAKRLVELLKATKDESFLNVKLADALISEVLVKAMGNSNEHVALCIELIVNLIKHPSENCVQGAKDLLQEKEKVLKWKEHLGAAQEIFKAISSVKVKNEEIIENYVSFTENFLDQLKKCKALRELNDGMIYFSLGCLELRNESLFELGSEVSERCTFDFKKNRALIFEVMKKLTILFNDKTFPWDNSESSSIAQNFIPACLEAISNKGKELTSDDRTVLIDVALSVVDKDFIHYITGEPGSVFYVVFMQIAVKLGELLDAGKELDRIEPLIPHFFNLLESDEELIVSMVNVAICMVIQKSGKPFAPELDKLILKLLDAPDYNLMSAVSSAYDYNSKPVKKHFQSLFDQFADSGDASIKTYYFMFMQKVAKTEPELFTEKNIKDLLKYCLDNVASEVLILQVVEEVAKRKVDKVMNHVDMVINLDTKVQQYSIHTLCGILKWIGMVNEKKAEQVIKFLSQKLEGPEDQTVTYGVIDAMKHIGSKQKPVLEKYRNSIESLKQRTANQTTKDLCTGVIDMLEGRSLEVLTDDIEDIKDDVEHLDTRVTTNENNVNEVKVDVRKTQQDVKKVKKNVNEQGQKLDEMGRVVDETVLKVEEIDQKTLSHAPYWSKDISKLLNPKTEHDWRLLSSRLGYNNDDIRAWSQQSDPCMAMLNEWYATHKTSEANYGILNSLQEMDRMDAAVIVENAMKSAEQVVEDEEWDYPSPPPIFLSYQWSHQEEVKLLHRHLQMAGYDCWLDIGQMGGGDKLFEKIDRGIRAAKVIISCTTEKYAKSPNCNREVNLSANLKKSIIPILLENCTWPPEGSMGPLFSEYLYIQFFQSEPADQTKDDRYWPPPKFQELLMQLSMNGIVPDESKVNKMYKNWWMPIVEEIKIDKKKTANGGQKKDAKPTGNNKQDDKSPDVFISYQWDKQKNVMLLYKRLTELGYHCWMDIHQMGGGDSLYDKIDRGIRGSQVILSCLTEKYTLSANCRREISLSDSLKRPIVPLLMENMSWPPRGPMSMAFTELLYIDFHSDPKIQEKWQGSKFDEMVGKIREILPYGHDRSASAATKDTNKNNNTATPSPPKPTKPVESSPAPNVNRGMASPVNRAMSGSKVKRYQSPTKSETSPSSKNQNSEPVYQEVIEPPRSVGNPKSKGCQIL